MRIGCAQPQARVCLLFHILCEWTIVLDYVGHGDWTLVMAGGAEDKTSDTWPD